MKPRLIGGIVVVATVLVALGLGVWAWRASSARPATNGATVSAPVVNIVAILPGRVVEVAVVDGQSVAAGALLFRIDPEPYELQLEQAKALLATAESELRQGEGNLILEQSNAEVAASQIERAENNLELTEASLARLLPLLHKGYVTAQEVDTARTLARDARVTLAQAQALSGGTAAFVGTLDTRRAQVDSARAAVALAEHNLRNTKIVAPRAGVLAGMTLVSGDFVVTAAPLFTLIDDSQWRVSALFRETDLPQIKAGDKALVFLLSAPTTAIHGTVTSIGWGVQTSDELNLFGLPYVASKLDWVQAARRFPVEIELEDPPQGLTRLGASASVRVVGQD